MSPKVCKYFCVFLTLSICVTVYVVSTLIAEDALEKYPADSVELRVVDYNCSADLVCDCEYCDEYPDCSEYLYTESSNVVQCCAKSADCGYQDFQVNGEEG